MCVYIQINVTVLMLNVLDEITQHFISCSMKGVVLLKIDKKINGVNQVKDV